MLKPCPFGIKGKITGYLAEKIVKNTIRQVKRQL